MNLIISILPGVLVYFFIVGISYLLSGKKEKGVFFASFLCALVIPISFLISSTPLFFSFFIALFAGALYHTQFFSCCEGFLSKILLFFICSSGGGAVIFYLYLAFTFNF